MTQFEQLDHMLAEQRGLIRLPAVQAAGISKPVFYDFVRSRGLEKLAPGIYCNEDCWVDAMYLFHLRFSQLVYSHDTALYFHDLTDREPLVYMVTVKTGYNTQQLKKEGLKAFTVKAELHGVGLTKAKTIFGNTVPVYDMERTICDEIRSRNILEDDTIYTALKEYVRHRDKNLNKLMKYAKMFHIDNILLPYLYVLL